jgi:hypothetical protein
LEIRVSVGTAPGLSLAALELLGVAGASAEGEVSGPGPFAPSSRPLIPVVHGWVGAGGTDATYPRCTHRP